MVCWKAEGGSSELGTGTLRTSTTWMSPETTPEGPCLLRRGFSLSTLGGGASVVSFRSESGQRVEADRTTTQGPKPCQSRPPQGTNLSVRNRNSVADDHSLTVGLVCGMRPFRPEVDGGKGNSEEDIEAL